MLYTALRLACGDRDLADEATQQAYVAMYRRWPQRQHLGTEANRRYVGGIIAHKIADHFRQWKRFAELDDVPGDTYLDPDVDEALPEYRILLDVIDKQPPRRRAVAVLFFLEEFDCTEIAETLEISTSTVRTQVQRTRDQLLPYARHLRDALKEASSHEQLGRRHRRPA
jgi:RNA polymerase sigma factor (sigma-70 family)